jgi:hypothetical protein
MVAALGASLRGQFPKLMPATVKGIAPIRLFVMRKDVFHHQLGSEHMKL